MLAHGSTFCPADIGAVLSLLPLVPALIAWLRWKIKRLYGTQNKQS